MEFYSEDFMATLHCVYVNYLWRLIQDLRVHIRGFDVSMNVT